MASLAALVSVVSTTASTAEAAEYTSQATTARMVSTLALALSMATRLLTPTKQRSR